MIGRRSIVGVAVLCALVVSAFAAANASAEQRAYTCQPVASGATFSDEHCNNAVVPPGGVGFKHFLITEVTQIVGTANGTATNTTQPTTSKLKGTISGLETEVQCTGLTGTGELTNAAASVTGNGTIEYTGCTVTAPAGRGCSVKGGTVTTKKLSATTVGQAANSVKFAPFEGTKFAEISIEGCLENIPPANAYPVTGSLVATATGATLTTTHAAITAQGNLKFGGQVAGLQGALTIRMKPETGKESNPITLT